MRAATVRVVFRRAGAVFFGAVALCLALALTRVAHASPALDAANRAFGEGRYADAAAQYGAIVSREGFSAPVLFDMGNAYLRADRLADAILAYERARLLAPRDHATANNLAAARTAAGVSEDEGLPDRLARWLSWDEWTWAATCSVWIALASGAGAVFLRRRRGALIGVASSALLAASVACAGLTLSCRALHAAIVTNATPALVSPFASAQSAFSLQPGASVQLRRAHDGYVLVQGSHGESGWVERAAVTPVVPD